VGDAIPAGARDLAACCHERLADGGARTTRRRERGMGVRFLRFHSNRIRRRNLRRHDGCLIPPSVLAAFRKLLVANSLHQLPNLTWRSGCPRYISASVGLQALEGPPRREPPDQPPMPHAIRAWGDSSVDPSTEVG
jgi:hypothetical protein